MIYPQEIQHWGNCNVKKEIQDYIIHAKDNVEYKCIVLERI